MLPSIYAHSRRRDFNLGALCHNRSQQETSDWPRGQRVCSFDFFFFFPGTFSPHRTEKHHLQFGGYVLLPVSQEYANTHFQFVEPRWGGRPWSTARPVPRSGAAEREPAERRLGGESPSRRSESRRSRCPRKIELRPFPTWTAFSHLLPIPTRDVFSSDKSLYFFFFFFLSVCLSPRSRVHPQRLCA